MRYARTFLLLPVLVVLTIGCAMREKKGGPGGTDLSATVTQVIGQVGYLPNGIEKWRPLKTGRKVHDRDVIKTGVESKAILKIADQGVLAVSENSLVALQFEKMPDGTDFTAANAKYGKFLANMGKLVGKGQFTVRTPTATAAIRGTSFITAVDRQTGISRVSVLRGEVAVKSRRYKSEVAGKLIADHVTEQRVLQDVDENNPAQVARVMQNLGGDWEHEVIKVAQERYLWEVKQLEQQARGKGLEEREIRQQVNAAKQSVETELQAVLQKSEETLVDKGKTVEVTETQVFFVKNIPAGEIETMKEEFSADVVEKALTASAPAVQAGQSSAEPASSEMNAAPSITSVPPTMAYENTDFEYPVTAYDPDGDDLLYRLAEAPEAMEIAAFTGVLAWHPRSSGTNRVVIEVDDQHGNVASQAFAVEVRQGLKGALSVWPKMGDDKTRFVFDGSDSRDQSGEGLLKFRWDFDGDGNWDYPRTGHIRKRSASYSYKEWGTYEARMEIVNAHGVSQILKERVVVDPQPKAIMTVAPAKALPGTEITFDASTSVDNGRLKYRWDFDADGAWDWPTDGYARSPVAKQVIARSYSGEAVVEIMDDLSQTASARTSYEVGFPCEARAMMNATKINLVSSAEFKGEARDKDGKIAEYAWDFDGDGRFDFVSDKTATVSHRYGKVGKYTAVFRAKSTDGSVAVDTVLVEVFNSEPIAKAGKDLNAKTGVKVLFDGKGEDPDGKITRYEWDFDGDGKFDYSSTKTGRVEYSYQKKGTYAAKLRVTSDDGATAESGVNVNVLVE